MWQCFAVERNHKLSFERGAIWDCKCISWELVGKSNDWLDWFKASLPTFFFYLPLKRKKNGINDKKIWPLILFDCCTIFSILYVHVYVCMCVCLECLMIMDVLNRSLAFILLYFHKRVLHSFYGLYVKYQLVKLKSNVHVLFVFFLFQPHWPSLFYICFLCC